MKENFLKWVEQRENQTITSENLDEAMGWVKKLFGSSIPTDPTQIYSHPEVAKWTNQWINDLHLNDPNQTEKVDGKPYTGLPKDIEYSMRRFVAGALFSKEEVPWLQISFEDSARILKFLDSIRRKGSTESLAEELNITSVEYLAHWYQGRYKSAGQIIRQQDYETRSKAFDTAYSTAKRLRTPLSSLPPEFNKMSQALEATQQLLQKIKARGRNRITVGLESEIANLYAQIARVLVDVKSSTPSGAASRKGATKAGNP